MVALIFIYNHRYENNIEPLEKIYGERFSNIFHLIPFYEGEKKNVIPIYEHSFYFQGYMAQAAKELMASGSFDHYMFVGDDLYLHPEMNENNYMEYLNINKGESFITHIHDLPTSCDLGFPPIWLHKAMYFEIPTKQGSGLEIEKQLPSYGEMLKILEKRGYCAPYIPSEKVYFPPKRTDFPNTLIGYFWYKVRQFQVKKLLANKQIKVSYPIVEGFADLVVIPQKEFKKFAHYCGLFASARLFVEYAVATSMLMTCEIIKTKKDLSRKCILYWGEEARLNFENKYSCSLENLKLNPEEEMLYVHPVKLSKWK